MEPRLTILTLGVADVLLSRRFYERVLGWTASPASTEAVVFFELAGVTLALCERSLLAKDAGLPVGRRLGEFSGISLTHVVQSRREVDDVLGHVAAAGGRIIRSARKVVWGSYAGYFADPDGHAWEVASATENFRLLPDGRIQLPPTAAVPPEWLAAAVA
jgi:uncharacterized glyoxalase superfamily protein PhnB